MRRAVGSARSCEPRVPCVGLGDRWSAGDGDDRCYPESHVGQYAIRACFKTGVGGMMAGLACSIPCPRSGNHPEPTPLRFRLRFRGHSPPP